LIVRFILGILLLIFGRSVFWLFVAAVGFLAGAQVATRALPGQPEWVILAIAIGVGLIGALLALLVPPAIGVIAGFVAGGYLALTLFELIGVNVGDLLWLPVLVGGLTGAAIVLVLFDYAVIALSSLVGALTIVDVLALHGTIALVIAALLFIIGVAAQTGLWRMRPSGGQMSVPR
jgi:hypothetical protein